MRSTPHTCRAGVPGCCTRTSPGLGARCSHDQPRDHRLRSWRPGAASPAGPLSSTADQATLLVYVMDIYDPASWAYLPSVSAVLSAACPVVDVEVVQSGRFATGSPAACLIALLAAGNLLPVSTVLEAVQHQYFVRGMPLDAPGVVGSIARQLGLDGPAIEIFAGSPRARELASEDFELAHDLDLGGGPLLLASRGEQVFEFDGPGASGARLVDQFRTVLTKP